MFVFILFLFFFVICHLGGKILAFCALTGIVIGKYFPVCAIKIFRESIAIYLLTLASVLDAGEWSVSHSRPNASGTMSLYPFSVKGLVGPIFSLEVMKREELFLWWKPNNDFSVD
jgi:hypothetical protein